MFSWNSLLPPNWKDKYLAMWFDEDFNGLDVSSAIVGEGICRADLLFKSSSECLLAGVPFVNAVFDYVGCKITWDFNEGTLIKTSGRIAEIEGPASAILKSERLALNLLARTSTIATNAYKLSKMTKSKLAGTRKTTPGFRLVEKYALSLAGIDTHRLSLVDCVMLKDNHIDAFGGDIPELVRLTKLVSSFTTKIEVECRSMEEAKAAILSGADIIMLDNQNPSMEDIQFLRQLNPKILIEISGGITAESIQNYPSDLNLILSLGSLTHSLPNILDFSLKIKPNKI